MTNRTQDFKAFETKAPRTNTFQPLNTYTLELEHDPGRPKQLFAGNDPWITAIPQDSQPDHIQIGANLNSQEWITLNIPIQVIPENGTVESLPIVKLVDKPKDEKASTKGISLHDGSRLRFSTDFEGKLTITRKGQDLTLSYSATGGGGFKLTNVEFRFIDYQDPEK
ncbi:MULTISPECIES: hypothetical protein [unclassified Pseudomonas]|uniref:hypothetical protein n=1 Tax=unclassified Pseudomonas TaxID=196821 RepID=UPI00244C5D25|nr:MULTISPECIES: hypothetical protein [unclassified Pseudomonas]MDH0303031.1 hypothetical protein [Pseudomonas sp. GD04091]MDH1986350.1 hypothetical protein [Pseudomonas sp. GD03689]